MDRTDELLQRRRVARAITAFQTHGGEVKDWWTVYQRRVPDFLTSGAIGLQIMNRKLKWFFLEKRNIVLALSHIRDRGGTAPGPDGLSICDLGTRDDFFAFADHVHRTLRRDEYRPGPITTIHARKTSGRGSRPIILMNLFDRVVHRAAMHVLRPIFRCQSELRFGLPAVFGIGREWLLARLERNLRHGRQIVLVDDLQDAFENVPQKKVLDIAKKYLGKPSPWIELLIFNLITSGKSRGLKQGAASSSMFLDLYLDHTLTRSWRRVHADWPLLRYCDDLAVAVESMDDAKGAAEELSRMLIPIAMTPKNIANDQPIIRNLGAGDSVDYLGFNVSWRGGKARFQVLDKTLDRIADGLVRLAERGRGLQMEDNLARRMIGWVQQQGPAFNGAIVELYWEAFRYFGQELRLPPPLPLENFRNEWLQARRRFESVRRFVANERQDYGL